MQSDRQRRKSLVVCLRILICIYKYISFTVVASVSQSLKDLDFEYQGAIRAELKKLPSYFSIFVSILSYWFAKKSFVKRHNKFKRFYPQGVSLQAFIHLAVIFFIEKRKPNRTRKKTNLTFKPKILS